MNSRFKRCLAGAILLSGIVVTLQAAQGVEIPGLLRQHVSCLSSDSLMGRRAGTAGEDSAAAYVYDRMLDAGVLMMTDRNGQDFAISRKEGDTLFSRNVVGIVQGYDESLASEYVVVGAHLDHIGYNLLKVDGNDCLQLFPGADNNASGVACLIELSRQIAATSYAFRRSVLFVAFGASEEGLAGSWYFVNRAFDEIDRISAMIDINSVGCGGAGDLKYFLPSVNIDLMKQIQAVSRESTVISPALGSGMAPSSDYLAFYEKGVPAVLFTVPGSLDRYSVRDDASRLDYDGMEETCEFIYSLILRLSREEEMVIRSGAPVMPDNDTLDVDKIYLPTQVDVPPQYSHSDERRFLQDWVYRYLKYPEEAIAMGIQGTVIVEFVVEKDGSVTNVRAVKYPDADLADEAVKVVSVSPKWKAGKIGKQKVRVKYQIPIEFILKKRKHR